MPALRQKVLAPVWPMPSASILSSGLPRLATIQNRQGFRVSCIEEIAWRKGWIDVDQLHRLGEQLGKTEYGKYLMELADSYR